MDEDKVYAFIDYEDTYVQPLLLAALKLRLPTELLVFINDISEVPTSAGRLLQWRQYEQIDFEHIHQNQLTSLANSYIIRKALIRKHYLSTTITHWLAKRPDSVLRKHVKPSVEFEVDYAEFLDDALVEAWDLKESWARNAALVEAGRGSEVEWWILKPGMSDRGQGIRLFSSEEELTAIFEEWDPDSEEEDDGNGDLLEATNGDNSDSKSNGIANGVMTSHLRHFIAQPYVDPPILLSSPHPSAGRKFHLRTYVLASGALKVHVYRQILALFASEPYASPTSTQDAPNESLAKHLTNTCLQNGDRDGSVHSFWDLPTDTPSLRASGTEDWKDNVFQQVCKVTGEVFEAAARSMSIHFQPLPNAFEIFALDFLVDASGTAWLLEVNAFPDFAQTGNELQNLIAEFFEGVVDVALKPIFGFEKAEKPAYHSDMVQVLDIDLGRR